MRELDVIFGRFVEQKYAQLSVDQQATFERLLEVQDPQIMDWLFGRADPDEGDMKELIESLQSLSGI